jgi:hypothetical protein
MKALRKHTDCRWVLLYVERWLKAPSLTDNGELRERGRGTPQGGVISPLLMNLFMHYAFDRWMRGITANCPFARYADDAVVHCRSEWQARWVKEQLAVRFAACGLELHPKKTRIVYCTDSKRRGEYPVTQFTVLGFTFRPRRAVSSAGKHFTGFLPGVSREAQKEMSQRIRSWHLPRQTPGTLAEFSVHYNAVLRGWWNFYGSFYPTALAPVFMRFDLALELWARRKFKRLRGHKRRSWHWLAQMARREPHLFVHWRNRYAKG